MIPASLSESSSAAAVHSRPLFDRLAPAGAGPERQRAKRFRDIGGGYLCPDAQCQGLPGKFIQNGLQLLGAPGAEFIVRRIADPNAATRDRHITTSRQLPVNLTQRPKKVFA
ncbi:MAG: hypothetical protein MK098_09380 [Marinovum sp.]|nr:hypothetical protein [Marinovum sp.]